MEKKICVQCQAEKNLSEYGVASKKILKKSGRLVVYYRNTCNQCESKAGSARYRKRKTLNPNMYKNDEYRAKEKAKRRHRYFYYKANGFNKHYNSNHPTKEFALFLWHMFHHQKGCCAISGHKLTANNMQIDHIEPRNPDYNNDYSNLRFVCKKANHAKNNMMDNEFKLFITDIYKHFVLPK
jgi:5-methylcytosine-specific restriction endonuclease McrA